ncbi:MAG: hypothetical protein HYS27_03320 [Deltaproteobacteria bacterium]|nr:hypothetical protein [Deltaproteobacteria bacterium]
MYVYAVNYDLSGPVQNYGPLIEALKGFRRWCTPTKSQWLIVSEYSAADVANYLLKFIDNDDRLIVTELACDAAWYGLPPDVSQWLKEVLGNPRGTARYY